jgi:transposase-like protein
MARRKRRQFTAAFKADAVRLCTRGGRSVGQVATDLDLTETALREWVKRAEADAGKGSPDVLASAEREELQQLRRDNKRLLMERDILKKAAAFFAKEST